jgi:uncharacterized protein YdeI (YjbR/CyaY-like superfamily)
LLYYKQNYIKKITDTWLIFKVTVIKIATPSKFMPKENLHKLPADLKSTLSSSPKAKAVWDDITPLAKNEWICWIISAKKEKTRKIRLGKTRSKLTSGMRRPCCWEGCPHR